MNAKVSKKSATDSLSKPKKISFDALISKQEIYYYDEKTKSIKNFVSKDDKKEKVSNTDIYTNIVRALEICKSEDYNNLVLEELESGEALKINATTVYRKPLEITEVLLENLEDAGFGKLNQSYHRISKGVARHIYKQKNKVKHGNK